MNTSYLKTFVEVVNMKNISRAAERLFITQPAVSKQLQILEKDFGSVLLKKDGRDIIPTDEGRLLFRYAVNLLSEENKIYSRLRKDGERLTGELIIYTSSLPADYYLHSIITGFSMLNPEITYTIKKVDSKAVYHYIEDGMTSFGFTGTPYKNNKIKTVCIAEDEVIVIGSKSKYGSYENKKMSLESLMRQDFIMREKGSATLKTFESFLNTHDLSIDNLRVRIQAEDNELIKTFVKNDMGIAVTSKIAAEREIKEGNIINIGVEGMFLKRKLYYVYHADRYFSKVEEEFREYVTGMYRAV